MPKATIKTISMITAAVMGAAAIGADRVPVPDNQLLSLVSGRRRAGKSGTTDSLPETMRQPATRRRPPAGKPPTTAADYSALCQVGRQQPPYQILGGCAGRHPWPVNDFCLSEPGGWVSGSDRPLRWPTGVCSAGASALHGRGPPHHPLTGMECRPSEPMYLLRPPRISPCPPPAGRQPQAVAPGLFYKLPRQYHRRHDVVLGRSFLLSGSGGLR
jgi:hypothetical protein